MSSSSTTVTSSASSKPYYFIGVDTGGTYTDAAIIEASSHQVIATSKAVTTKGDLSVGVKEAIELALSKLPNTLHPEQINLLSVSTTLATNAVVEGHGSAVGVVLIGFDADMIHRTGIDKAFPGVVIIAVAGGHDHSGYAQEPLDLESLQTQVLAVSPKVDAFAIASRFAVRNAEHEIQARDFIIELTGKPVTLSTELSSSLDAPRRALTATLNARLISRVSHLIEAVSRAMQQLSIQCPLMIVKGDGTLALAETVVKRPIETVLSGPAASLVGAKWLSGLDSFLMSDMGGTTTDLGVLIDGKPKVTEEGADVGGWRTMVRAVDIKTVGLGGDSEVHIATHGGISVGPQRAVPIALLAHRYPETVQLLQVDLDDVDRGGSMHGKFVLLPFGSSSTVSVSTYDMTEREAQVLAKIKAYPQALRKIADSLPAQKAVASLRKKGLIQLASFTPSDAAHVLQLQANWNSQAAMMAALLLVRFKEMRMPTPEMAETFSRAVWSETVRVSAHLILDTAWGIALGNNPVAQAVCKGQTQVGLVEFKMSPTVPVVAVGGPVKVYYEEVAQRLQAQMVFAENCDVANAVGAATGVVAQQVQVVINGDGSGVFTLLSTVGTQQFLDPHEALDAAQQLAKEHAIANVLKMGAEQPEVKISVTKKLLPRAVSDTGLLEAVIVAEAVGRPLMR